MAAASWRCRRPPPFARAGARAGRSAATSRASTTPPRRRRRQRCCRRGRPRRRRGPACTACGASRRRGATTRRSRSSTPGLAQCAWARSAAWAGLPLLRVGRGGRRPGWAREPERGPAVRRSRRGPRSAPRRRLAMRRRGAPVERHPRPRPGAAQRRARHRCRRAATDGGDSTAHRLTAQRCTNGSAGRVLRPRPAGDTPESASAVA